MASILSFAVYKIIFAFGMIIRAEDINGGPLITMTGRKIEESGFTVYELNCTSVRQPLDNSAEFIFNRRTLEHISVYDEKCFNSEEKECNVNLGTNCDCVPNSNIFIFKFKGHNNDGNIFTCQMRFNEDSTSNIIKAFVSIKFHGSEAVVYEYDAKSVGNGEGDNKNVKNASDSRNLEVWLPVGLCISIIIITIIGTVWFCTRRKRAGKRSKECTVKRSKIKRTQLTSFIEADEREKNIDENHKKFRQRVVVSFLAIVLLISLGTNMFSIYFWLQNIESHDETNTCTVIEGNQHLHQTKNVGLYLAAIKDKIYLALLGTNITLEVVKYAEVNVILCKEENYIITCNKPITGNCIVLSSGKLHDIILENKHARYLINMQCVDEKLVGLKWTYHFSDLYNYK